MRVYCFVLLVFFSGKLCAQATNHITVKLQEPLMVLTPGHEIGEIRGTLVRYKENDSYVFSKRSSRRVICEASMQTALRFLDCENSRYSGFKYVAEAPFVMFPKIVDCRLNITTRTYSYQNRKLFKGQGELLVDWLLINDNESHSPVLTFHTRVTGNYFVEFDSHLMDSLLKESFHQLILNDSVSFQVEQLVTSTLAKRHQKSDKSEVITIPRSGSPIMSQKETLRSAKNAVVTIEHEEGFGSGFIISSSGYLLTNYHVVDGYDYVNVRFSNGSVKNADVIRFDKHHDLALLLLSDSTFTPLPIGNSDSLEVGDELFAIGTPGRVELGQSITKGILSGIRQIDNRVFIQSDVSINSGNSGGPLINLGGEVVGIATMKLVGKGVEGLGFGIPINDALRILNIKLQ